MHQHKQSLSSFIVKKYINTARNTILQVVVVVWCRGCRCCRSCRSSSNSGSGSSSLVSSPAAFQTMSLEYNIIALYFLKKKWCFHTREIRTFGIIIIDIASKAARRVPGQGLKNCLVFTYYFDVTAVLTWSSCSLIPLFFPFTLSLSYLCLSQALER